MRAGRIILHLLTGFGLMTLAACMDANDRPATAPPPQDAALPAPDAEAGPSSRSRALERHYANVQRSLLARGLLRTDGGGVDTPYDADDLLRNFERIAFYDEYARDGGLRHSDGQAGGLRKWAEPVRIAVEFGESVPKEQREEDRQAVAAYSARLSRITGHPIRAGATRPNFNVLIMGEDDRDRAISRIRQIVPGISPNSIDLFRGLPRSIHCLVVAFSSGDRITSTNARSPSFAPSTLTCFAAPAFTKSWRRASGWPMTAPARARRSSMMTTNSHC